MRPRPPRIPRPRRACLALASALVLSPLGLGCGGPASSTDDAILVQAPDFVASNPTAGATTGTTPAPTDGTSPPAAPATVEADATKPAAAPAAAAGGYGTLKGKVTFAGDPPTLEPLVAKGRADVPNGAYCAKEAIPSERLIVDAASKGVKNVLVYIPKPVGVVSPEAKSAAMAAAPVFDQKGCIFEPHVLAAMVGSKILIKSSDQVGHNVDSKVSNNAMNSAISAGAEMPYTTQGATRQPGQVICDIHPWMTAYWYVSENPYFAVTDAQGNFEIKNVPAGNQKVVVWQESAAFVTPSSGADVAIAANGETSKDFAIDAAKVKLK